MERASAAELRRIALSAIESLSEFLEVSKGVMANDDHEAKRRTVGSLIGPIQRELLGPLYLRYPELDDLKD